MIELFVTVVILLNGQPSGESHRFQHREMFHTLASCEEAYVTSGPVLAAYLAHQLNGPKGDTFRMTHECVSPPIELEPDLDRVMDIIQEIFRELNRAGGIGGVGR